MTQEDTTPETAGKHSKPGELGARKHTPGVDDAGGRFDADNAPLLARPMTRMLRVGESKLARRFGGMADRVLALEERTAALSDDELRSKTDEFKQRHADGESLERLMPEAFAVVREAAWRVAGMKPFRVQVIGGIALHYGTVAEMATGEGKTLVAILPAYLNALPGLGVHVVTVNDYLAQRDAEWVGSILQFLGLTVGVVTSGLEPPERKEAYASDVTYGIDHEFGFDYLRDNMAESADDLVQRGHNYAIVDEVDSILIDEARTPLLISGNADTADNWYEDFAAIAEAMERDVHYEIDERAKIATITDEGVAYVEDQLGARNLYEPKHARLVGQLNNAIRAKELYHRDTDYIVAKGEPKEEGEEPEDEVLIVDEFTGRVLEGHRYNEGLHQAIEAKESVKINEESQTLATTTLQNYFRLYTKLAGMTGTAMTEAAEFHNVYDLDVVTIPTNRPVARIDRPDVIYKTAEAKFAAVAKEVAARHAKGQPVLVGTTSVEQSELLSGLLDELEVPHEVLNAKQPDREAMIVANAGRVGAVSVATNMAGRGTDIRLGGTPEVLAEEALRKRGLDPDEDSAAYEEAFPAALSDATEAAKTEAEQVRQLGGLMVIGTGRHEARRIDNQLRGRAGRQGDPGETQFYLSLGDDVMMRFQGTLFASLAEKAKVADDQPITSRMISAAIRSAQTQVEQLNAEIRKEVLRYDEVMEEQREVIYTERRRLLLGEDVRDQVLAMFREVVHLLVEVYTSVGYPEDWELDDLHGELAGLYPVEVDFFPLIDPDRGEVTTNVKPAHIEAAIMDDVYAQYDRREAQVDGQLGSGAMRDLERSVLISVLDRFWRAHLYEMDYLRAGVNLRAMAGNDPLADFQRESYDLFLAMLEALREEAMRLLFFTELKVGESAPQQGMGR